MIPLTAILVGFVFGALLQKTGLARYDRIVNVFRFRDLTVLKFLLSALVSAAIGIQALRSLGVTTTLPLPSTYPLGNGVGGVVFGVGMALSGFCPGTVAAGAGEGRMDNLIAGGAGLFLGALLYGLAYPRIMPVLARGATIETVPQWIGGTPWLVITLLFELTLLTFYVLERAELRTSRAAAVATDGD